jgi:hypothetical protein
MKKFGPISLMIVLLTAAVPAFANVVVNSPQTGQTVSSPAKFQATANTTTCAKGVASMGVYVDNKLEYVVNGTSMNSSLALTPGKHNVAVQEWDFCGGATLANMPLTVVAQDGVWVSSPSTNTTVGRLTNYVATSTTNCPQGVAAMGVYVNNQLVYTVQGAKLDTQMNLSPGAQHTAVQAWDNCGGSSMTPIDVTVPVGTTFSNLQASPGWLSSGQLAPAYADCDFPCPGVSWGLTQGVSSPSLSGKATEWSLGGTTPYSDVLFYNQLIGVASTQGLPDQKHTLIPTLHNFTYDAYFYVTDATSTQAMEFDINMFLNSVGMTWGTECRMRGGNEWDIWDNVNAKWIPTGFACNPLVNQWNHVTVTAQRGANNTLLYQSITLNGVTANINKTYPPFSVPADWYGVTVNYQMDGDEYQTPIKSYLDNFSFTYW